MTAVLALPAKLDLASAGDLAGRLRDAAGADLTLDASAVTLLGTPGLQVLIAARKSWAAAGLRLSLDGAGAPIDDQLARFGLGRGAISTEAETVADPVDPTQDTMDEG